MLKKVIRKIRPNPLDILLKKAKKNNKKKFLLAWNRALGDISLGLYAVVFRIREYIKDAKITFLIREDLKEGFELLEDVNFITVAFWRRYLPFDIHHTLNFLNIDYKSYDVIIDKVDPTYWVKWQISNLIPKLRWKKEFDELHKKFSLPENKILIGVQPTIETKHSPWRNWPIEYFKKLFKKASKDIVFILFGTNPKERFDCENIIDLRGKTSLLEVLSILKNRCLYFISLDSGLLSLFYYLNIDFPIKLITLWGSKDVGVIKQNVKSPNDNLIYIPLLYERCLATLKPEDVLKCIYPYDIEKLLFENNQKALFEKFKEFSIEKKKKAIKEFFLLDPKVLKKQKVFFSKKDESINFESLKKANKSSKKDYYIGKKIISSRKVATIIMAAGQGTRLGFSKPKGLFKINNKTLFEYIFEKILIKQKVYETRFYISIMTSHLNNLETIDFLKKNKFFGLEKDQIDFFVQRKAPFLDKKGNWILKDNKILQTPDGNGSIFTSFDKAWLLSKYLEKKIKYVSIVPIDNPLCDPFDENFFGFHENNKNEVTIKCIKREKKDEKKGIVALCNDKIKIVEYINLDKKENYEFSNSGIYLFDIDFIKRIKDIELDYNFVLKKVSNNSEIFAYKSENFIFDSFVYANKIKILVDKKENFYFPLKDISDLKNLEKLLLGKPFMNVVK
jgi:UDP-N-acetylglucosamine pyrophosphorylase/ADP-heptose:LPS heptosyltransferase